MNYRKTYNSLSVWSDYCAGHQDLIKRLSLPPWVFEKESNFREFASKGKTSRDSTSTLDFDQLGDKVFWELFAFITNYFDYDASLFQEFENARKRRYTE